MEMEVTIYTKDDCPFCIKAKDWLKGHGITYTENLMNDEEQRLALYQKLNGVQENIHLTTTQRRVNSVPQIFIDNKHIGGYDEMMLITDKLIKKRGGLMKFNLTYKPFLYPWAVELTTRHEKAHWVEDEVDFSEDVSDGKGG